MTTKGTRARSVTKRTRAYLFINLFIYFGLGLQKQKRRLELHKGRKKKDLLQ